VQGKGGCVRWGKGFFVKKWGHIGMPVLNILSSVDRDPSKSKMVAMPDSYTQPF
jgi:hypothetical protein